MKRTSVYVLMFLILSSLTLAMIHWLLLLPFWAVVFLLAAIGSTMPDDEKGGES